MHALQLADVRVTCMLCVFALLLSIIRQAALLRRAAYVYRMPTQEQRTRVGLAWLERGTRAAWDSLLKAGVPLPPPPPPA
jgi:hypothetical protein